MSDPEEEFSDKISFREIIRSIFLILLIVIPIRVLLAEPFVVSGSSMIPTFKDGDYLIIDKISYKLSSPKRNDVVIFKYPNEPKRFFIKRIIGLPNETIDLDGKIVKITSKDPERTFVLDQSYIENESNSTFHVKLNDREYFVMGDNRSASSDSRVWGPLDKRFITGKALIRLLPLNNIDVLPGKY